MLRSMPTVAAGEPNFSRLCAWLLGPWLLITTIAPAQAWAEPIGTISVDGPSARLTVSVIDPITCAARELGPNVAGETWPALCVQVSSDADASGAVAYAFTGRLAYNPDRAYYDADEDLVHPYYGLLTWNGAQSLATGGDSTASVELTATKEGHQSGPMVVILNGIGDIPIGTRLSVSLVGDPG